MHALRNHKSKEELLKEIEQEDFKRRTVSFYKYVTIKEPQEMRDRLFEKFAALNCKGRIYVAAEGINAQMNVPIPNWDDFDKFIQGIPEFAEIPYKIAREEIGQSSFVKLKIKVKERIVADGITDETFNASNTGKYMTAEDVNAAIDDPDVLVVDMRNQYEAEVGHFENAHIMQVDTFREQLAEVDKELGKKKDKKILMYCTGGIRCEKASAWFKHKGFKDVYHVKGGIIDYDRQVKEKGLENKFKGKNFVFDERLGERISDDIIAKCHLCRKQKCDTHHNCKNSACHILFIGCDACVEKQKGYCSWMCRQYDKIPPKQKKVLTRWINKIPKKYRPVFRPRKR